MLSITTCFLSVSTVCSVLCALRHATNSRCSTMQYMINVTAAIRAQHFDLFANCVQLALCSRDANSKCSTMQYVCTFVESCSISLPAVAIICLMIHRIPGHAAKFGTRLWCVLVCVISIAPSCVNAIQARIVAVHVNAPHHTWLLIRMNEHSSCCNLETWLILPVVICLYQRLSHACVCIYFYIVKPRIAH